MQIHFRLLREWRQDGGAARRGPRLAASGRLVQWIEGNGVESGAGLRAIERHNGLVLTARPPGSRGLQERSPWHRPELHSWPAHWLSLLNAPFVAKPAKK